MHLSLTSSCSHFHEMKHGVSIVCTYTLYANTTYSSEDTVRENQCALLFMSFKKHTIYYQWPTISKVASSRRLIWVCVDSEQKPVEVPWQHWKLAWINKNNMLMTFRGAPTWSPLSNHETWPVLMGSLVGCKPKHPYCYYHQSYMGVSCDFFVCPQFPTTCMYTSCACPCIVTLLDLEDRPTQQEFTKFHGDTPSIAQNKLGQFGTPSNHC